MNYHYLHGDEKDKRLHNMHSLYCHTMSKLDHIRACISQATSDSGVQLYHETHDDMVNMMESASAEVEVMYPGGLFQRIFWEEQKKALQCTDSRQVR